MQQAVREILIFLLCCVCSILMWLTNALNKVHSSAAESTQATAQVMEEQTTDKAIEVPIEVIGTPVGKTIHVFPSKAVIFLRVRMSDYERIGAKSARVWCTYPKTGEEMLTLHVEALDDAVLHISKPQPESVEWMEM